MGEPELTRDFLDLLSAFNVHDVRYLVVGGIAYSTHVEPRFTKDLDVWIDVTPENAKRAWKALAAFGAPLRDLTPQDLATPGVLYQVGVPPGRIDVLTKLEGVSFDDAWRNRVQVHYESVPSSVIGVDELIANKRAVGRPQDKQDVRNLERRAKRSNKL